VAPLGDAPSGGREGEASASVRRRSARFSDGTDSVRPLAGMAQSSIARRSVSGLTRRSCCPSHILLVDVRPQDDEQLHP